MVSHRDSINCVVHNKTQQVILPFQKVPGNEKVNVENSEERNVWWKAIWFVVVLVNAEHAEEKLCNDGEV